MSNVFIRYVVDADFIDKIEENKILDPSACDIDMLFVHGRMLLSPLVLICMYERIIIYYVIYYQC
jgi:hypothetical protein